MPNFNIKINGKNLDVKNIDAVIKHEYIPDLDWNQGDDKTVVTCRYLKAGEKTKYMMINADQALILNFRKIFEDKVDSVTGFSVCGKELTKEDILNCIGFDEADQLISNVALHLSKGLSDDEVKN